MDHGKNLDSPIPAAGNEEIDLLSLLYSPIDLDRLFSIAAPEQGRYGYDIDNAHDAHYSAEVASWALPAQSTAPFFVPDNADIRTFDLLSSAPHWTPPRILSSTLVLPLPVLEPTSVRPPQRPRESDDGRSLSPLTSISDGSSRSPTPETVQPPHAEGCAICGQVRPLHRTCGGVAGRWCEACYRYRFNNGKERPERLWNPPIRPPDERCSICGQAKPLHRSLGGIAGVRCNPCHRYKARTREERPERLWRLPVRRGAQPAADHVCGDCGGKTKQIRRSCLGMPGLRCYTCYERLRTWIRCRRSAGLPLTALPFRAGPSSVPDATAEDIADEEEVRNTLLDFTDET
ncbi:hypothetical protein C8F01DRAFT_1179664 [Mycena amicta]|nr:hypothetical protein C8F01DRAFT_1179664 [Mycena amicta]